MKTLITFAAITAVLHLAGCTKSNLRTYNSPVYSFAGSRLTVIAGPDRLIKLDDQAILEAEMYFDGSIPLQLNWSLLSGPGVASIDSATSQVTKASVTKTGIYVFAVEVNNGKGLFARDTQQVEVWQLPDPATELVFKNLVWESYSLPSVSWNFAKIYPQIDVPPSPLFMLGTTKGKYFEVWTRTDTAVQFVPAVRSRNLPGFSMDTPEVIFYEGELISAMQISGPPSLFGKKVDLKIRF